MQAPEVIDAHVYVGRNEHRWKATSRRLRAAGIDTAVLSPDPHSYDLASNRSLPAALSRTGGPFALWYIGGAPFGGIEARPADLPRDTRDYAGIDWHCFFSAAYDYGSADGLAATTADDLLRSTAGSRAVECMAEVVAAGLPIRMLESLPVSLSLIERFPDGRFVIPHMGLRSGGCSRVLNAMADQPNVYFDTAGVDVNEGMVGVVGPDRVLLSSDAPLRDPVMALRQVRSLKLPPAQLSMILGDNARRLFGPASTL